MKRITTPVVTDKNIGWDLLLRFSRQCMTNIVSVKKSIPSNIGFFTYSKLINLLHGNQTFWLSLLPEYDKEKSSVLVIDDSFGNLSYRLSLVFNEVITVHQDSRALEVIGCYLGSRNVDNVQLIKTPIGLSLPVSTSTVSVVIACRLSNYINQYSGSNHKNVYKKVISELNRVLVSDGTILMLDNSKRSYQSIAGNIRNFRLFNERIGASFVKNRSLLIKNGFNVDEYIGKYDCNQTLDGAPSYHNYNFPSVGDPLKYRILTNLKLRLLCFPLIKNIWPSFLLVATKSTSYSLVKAILMDARLVDSESVDNYCVKRIIGGNAGVVVVIVGKSDSHVGDLVFRSPDNANEAAMASVAHNWSVLCQLADSDYCEFIPRNVVKGCYKGRHYYIEQRKEGRDLESGDSGPEVYNAIRNSFSLLVDMQINSITFDKDQGDFFDDYFKNISSNLVTFCSASDLEILNKIGAYISKVVREQEFSLVMIHGDFKPGNILYHKDGSVSAIIDWDQSQSTGFPLVDIYMFLIYHVAKEQDSTIWDTFNDHILCWDVKEQYHSIVESVINKFGINKQLLLPLRCITWLMIVNIHINILLTHPYTISEVITTPFNKMLLALEKEDDSKHVG